MNDSSVAHNLVTVAGDIKDQNPVIPHEGAFGRTGDQNKGNSVLNQ
ncbi:MAG: hypothetical protein H7249_14075 [Chitinophagaceae bacterium]|nr:hypothetical protein [Oligoflexus sp.]